MLDSYIWARRRRDKHVHIVIKICWKEKWKTTWKNYAWVNIRQQFDDWLYFDWINYDIFCFTICYIFINRDSIVFLFAAALLEGANQLCQKHDDKNFECLSCGKYFSHQSNCKRHIRIEHLGEQKNATCPNCEKQVLKTDIKRHMKKHCSNRHLYQESQSFSFMI